MERLVLVDRDGKAIGTAEKLEAHRGQGALHLAFSSLVVNAEGDLLLQRRAQSKYHFAGLWSNSCCGHPRPGESVQQAAERRLDEEFGLRLNLQACSEFIYCARDAASGMVEHEYLHVLRGLYSEGDGPPSPDPAEIGAWAWRSRDSIRAELARTPEHFSPWFSLVLNTVDEPGLGPIDCA